MEGGRWRSPELAALSQAGAVPLGAPPGGGRSPVGPDPFVGCGGAAEEEAS